MSQEVIHENPELAEPAEPGEDTRTRRDGRRRRSLIAGLAAVTLAAAGLGAYQYARAHAPRPADGGTPPWPIPADPLPGIRAAGLAPGPMGHAEHYHAHLDVFVDGEQVEVPADIGIVGEEMAPVHTHDDRGVIHIESHHKGDVFTLGQIFKEWGVTLSASQIGALKAGGGKVLTTVVDGRPYAGDPASLVLTGHQQIALVYGTPDPSFRPPARFTFKSDE
ncbi:hypothetical protein MF672_005620 [Actinomadura sp. ATCC 31491]|uniref:Uncharacterized protein n=1 Tax=Actinomadura luzonensis TaxID=2805427 RepID=A0ABT0FLW8_9ACTN|nr:hypothetical protein [Actinomadura luzonensis]MCK2213276.1 hypothetical protein [Actinomadura luzonensis]